MNDRWRPLSVESCDENPFVQFRLWFDEARPLVAEREAITLVTASLDAHPSARMVLLRHIDDDCFGWYTNYESRKGAELLVNPHAALLWYCEALGRQVRIEGHVARMSPEQSDAYFAQRPRGSQLGAHASHQSAPLASREELEERVAQVSADFEGRDVTRPDNWGGYKLTPTSYEFWQHREDRLHDRVIYSPDGALWERQRYSP